ncbi:MAG: DUF2007 domain-containing protein [Planctomycetes bacterium]|nr:DUF2007 domain-containing protein [Planctomycetota bacterium]
MSGNLKVIAKYGTPEEAHLLRNHLEAAGIRVFLEGEVMSAWAWHMANAMGGVKLLVPEESVEAAREILGEQGPDWSVDVAEPARDSRSRDHATDSWTCPKCRSEVDLNMDVCWACGATADGEIPEDENDDDDDRDAIDDEFEDEPEEPDAPPPDVAFLTILFPPTFAYFLFTKACHLFAPLVPDVRHDAAAGTATPDEIDTIEPADARGQALQRETPSGERPGTRSDEEALDALSVRAWRAAWMGFFLLPPLVMTLYSTWLTVHYWLGRRGPNRRRDRRALWTLGINLVAALCLGFLLSLAIGSLSDGVRSEPEMGPVEEEQAPYLGH